MAISLKILPKEVIVNFSWFNGCLVLSMFNGSLQFLNHLFTLANF